MSTTEVKHSPGTSTLSASDTTSKEVRLVEHVLKTAKKGDPDSVLKTIDTFGWGVEWMMNVGDLKGLILDRAIKARNPKTVLELGLYCGYSATRISRLLPEGGKLISVEKNPAQIPLASKVIAHAGLEGKVQILEGGADEVIPTIKEKTGIQSFDLIFIDHVKDRYLGDFKLLESAGLVAKGTVIVADNVIYPGAPDYLEYIRNNPHYDSVFTEAKLEYKQDQRDGVEVSTRKD